MGGETWVDDPKLLHQTGVQLEREHSSRFVVDKNYLRLYYQRPASTIPDPDRPWREAQSAYRFDLQGYNLMRRQVRTALSMLCRPLRPVVEPTSAEFETIRGCSMLTDFLDGVFDGVEFLAIATDAERDACLTTVGAVKWSIDDETGDVQCERVDPLNILWHYGQGANPLELYQVEPVPRAKLAALFPRKRREIEDLPTWRRELIVGVEPSGIADNDCVRVTEGWRRRIGNETGRHTIVCHDLVLLDEAWDHDFFPVVTVTWERDFRSFGGVPLARAVAPYHQIQNRCARKVHDSLNGAVPIVVVHEDDDEHTLTDTAFQRVVWRGAHKPEITPANPVSPQLLEYVRALPDECAAETGVSSRITSGQRPAGLNSAPAQREWMEIEALGLVNAQTNWEALWRNSGRAIIGLCSTARTKPRTWRKLTGGNVLEEIAWSKIKLDPKDYRVRYMLTSGLPLTASGRQEQLAEFKANGAIDQAEYMRHLNVPDLEQAANRANAPRDLIERQVSQCLNDGEIPPVSAMQPLDDLIRIATTEYQRAMVTETYPDAHLECLRRYIKNAEARKNASQPAAAPAAQAPLSGAAPAPAMAPQPAPPVMNA